MSPCSSTRGYSRRPIGLSSVSGLPEHCRKISYFMIEPPSGQCRTAPFRAERVIIGQQPAKPVDQATLGTAGAIASGWRSSVAFREAGKRTVKQDPLPKSLVTEIVPPISTQSFWLIESPNPLPPY